MLRFSRSVIGLLLMASSLPLFSQSERPLDSLGTELVAYLLRSESHPDSMYITLPLYHTLIDRQPLSRGQKSDFKQEVNGFHPQQHREFSEGVYQLSTIYQGEMSRGVEVSLDSIWTREMDGARNIFEVRFQLNFYYPDEKINSPVFLDTMVGTIRRRYYILAPLTESYD